MWSCIWICDKKSTYGQGSWEAERWCTAVRVFILFNLRYLVFDAFFLLRMKFFSNPLLNEFRQKKLQPNFLKTFCIKPPSSRPDSGEAYFLCQGWRPLAWTRSRHSGDLPGSGAIQPFESRNNHVPQAFNIITVEKFQLGSIGYSSYSRKLKGLVETRY